jgi:hypothetical protein
MSNDPFSGGGPFGNSPFGNSPFGGAPRRPKFSAAPPEQAEAAKSSLLDKGLTGLQYVGSVLDKPGRAVRGALAGNWREGLGAAIPFSDSLGITDDKQAVSPEDLLVKRGILSPNLSGQNTPFFSSRNLASTAAGIALDPLSYLTFGGSALSRAGQAAKAVGATRGMGKEALIQGFTHLEPELQAAGWSAEEIAHLGRSGARVAPTSAVDAARAAGVDLKVGTPLAGHFGVGLPFQQPAFTVGHGATAQALARVGDAAGNAVKYAPGVRTLRQWFDTNAGRSSNPIAQRAHEAAAVPLRQTVEGNTGVWEYGVRQRLDALLQQDPSLRGHELQGLNLIRQEAEKIGTASDPQSWAADFASRHAQGLTPGVTDPTALTNHVVNNFDAYRGIGSEINQHGKDLIEQARRYGADPHVLADTEAEYARRQYVAGFRGDQGMSARPTQPFGTSGMFDRARQDVLKDVPGGAAMIDRFAMDPRLSGPNRTFNPGQVQQHLMDTFLQHTAQARPLTQTANEALASKAAQLEPVLGGLEAVHAERQVPFYNPDVIADYVTRANAHAKSVGGAAGAVEGLASGARPMSSFAPGEAVSLSDALDRVGLTTHRPHAPVDPADLAHLQGLGFNSADEARHLIGQAPTDPAAAARVATIDPTVRANILRQGYDGGAARLYEQMARHGAPLQDLTTGAFDPHSYLGQYGISNQDVRHLSEYMQGFSTPHEAGPFLSHLDSLQNLFKAMTYPLHPASHTRNALSALYNNFVHGTPWGAYRDAYKIMRGEGLDHANYAGLTPTMSPAERAQYLAGQAYGHGGVFSGGSFNEVSHRPTLDSIDTTSGMPHALTPQVPGAGRFTPGGSLASDTARLLSEAIPRSRQAANPFGVRGVSFGNEGVKRTRDTFAPLIAGRKVGENVEDYARLANYLGNLRKGMAPDVAGRMTKAVHFDYGDLTPFEKNYARKLVPFYTFARKNLPAQADLLLNRPSAIAPTIRAMGASNPNGDYVPDYLSSGPAVGLGQTKGPNGENFTRFLTSFGLPLEEALERFKFQSRDIGGHQVALPDLVGTGASFLGMANPYFKAPIEMATDTQLHTGRRLSDLHQPSLFNGYGAIGGPFGNFLSEVGANSPLTRFGSTISKLGDERKPGWAKALNFLTGVKISDVDTEKARNIEARKAMEEMMRQDPRMAQFVNFYVKPGAEVDPALQAQMETYARFQREAHAASEARRKMGLMGNAGLTGGTVPTP